jgi:hypothetical protein
LIVKKLFRPSGLNISKSILLLAIIFGRYEKNNDFVPRGYRVDQKHFHKTGQRSAPDRSGKHLQPHRKSRRVLLPCG